MWRRVELKNYRSIEKVSVDLAPFTVLVGPNGSGKSNFADALVFARDVQVDAATAVERRGGIVGVRRWRPAKPTDVTVDVRAAESRPDLDKEYARHLFMIHSGKDGAWRFRREIVELVEAGQTISRITRKDDELDFGVPQQKPPSDLSDERLFELSSTASAMVLARQLRFLLRSGHSITVESMLRLEALRSIRRVRLNPEAMRLPQATAETTRLDESGGNIAVAYRSLKEPSKKRVLLAMQKIVPGLSRISVEPFDRFLLLKFEQRQAGQEHASFSGSEMSEGALRALGILVAAEQMTAGELLIIEEPEVSIHVGAAQLLFEVLKRASTRGAVLITTHSADLLDAARDEEILVCSYRNGITRIGPLASAQRAVVKEGLFSVAELMRSEPLRIEGEPPDLTGS